MPNLRKAVIKLAHDNPGEVRDALLPILKQAVGIIESLESPIQKAVRRAGVTVEKGLRQFKFVKQVKVSYEVVGDKVVIIAWFSVDEASPLLFTGVDFNPVVIIREAFGIHYPDTKRSGKGWEVRIGLLVLP